MLKLWIFYMAYGFDLWFNAVLFGSPRETVSSRCYRLNHIRAYGVAEVILNTLAYPFDGPNHCKQSYDYIVEGRYFPPNFYTKSTP